MNHKKQFSIIEMLTVVFIILLLISLITPAFTNLKMNARTANCKNHLRQIGTLLNSYQTDNNGYLPNFDMLDIPKPSVGNNQLYRNWNGHLLPYIDINLPDKYTRYAMYTVRGTTRFHSSQLGGPPNPPPANVLTNGWIVVDDAQKIGGYQDLKTFICPEILQNTFDVAASIKFNGVKIPRIQKLCTGGVTSMSAIGDTKGYDYSMAGGIPTTYLGNDIFFGYRNQKNSYRIDQIRDVSEKALILEGGIADAYGDGSNGSIGATYYTAIDYNFQIYDGGDLSFGSFSKPQFHRLSYVHDNIDKFWVMYSMPWSWYFPNTNRVFALELAAKFNTQFAGKASIISGPNTSSGFFGCSIVSVIDPGDGSMFTSFLKANGYNGTLKPFTQYADEPNDFKYLTGNMNVLFGDSSVLVKDQTWLCNNRRKIALD